MKRHTPRRGALANTLGLILLPLALAGCALLSPTVDDSTRDSISSQVHAGMTMTDARTELESMDYVCHTRTGAYVDEYGNEHSVNAPFAVCDEQPGAVSFVCNDRTQVTLIPDGGRVRSVQIDKAPSCIKR